MSASGRMSIKVKSPKNHHRALYMNDTIIEGNESTAKSQFSEKTGVALRQGTILERKTKKAFPVLPEEQSSLTMSD